MDHQLKVKHESEKKKDIFEHSGNFSYTEY